MTSKVAQFFFLYVFYLEWCYLLSFSPLIPVVGPCSLFSFVFRKINVFKVLFIRRLPSFV